MIDYSTSQHRLPVSPSEMRLLRLKASPLQTSSAYEMVRRIRDETTQATTPAHGGGETHTSRHTSLKRTHICFWYTRDPWERKKWRERARDRPLNKRIHILHRLLSRILKQPKKTVGSSFRASSSRSRHAERKALTAATIFFHRKVGKIGTSRYSDLGGQALNYTSTAFTCTYTI